MRTTLSHDCFKPRIVYTQWLRPMYSLQSFSMMMNMIQKNTHTHQYMDKNNAIPMHEVYKIRGHSFALKYIANPLLRFTLLFRGKLIETYNKIFGWIV